MVMSDFRPEVEIWPFRACTMHPAIIIGTVHSMWIWLWGRYRIPQNAFLLTIITTTVMVRIQKQLSQQTDHNGSIKTGN